MNALCFHFRCSSHGPSGIRPVYDFKTFQNTWHFTAPWLKIIMRKMFTKVGLSIFDVESTGLNLRIITIV